jgi:hypothetical protein
VRTTKTEKKFHPLTRTCPVDFRMILKRERRFTAVAGCLELFLFATEHIKSTMTQPETMWDLSLFL